MERSGKIILCFLIVLLFSCEKQRFLNVPLSETQYVINGLFSVGNQCSIEISQSQYLNDTNAVKNVGNANVSLFEDDIFIEELTYVVPPIGKNLGTYKSNFSNFVKTKKYSIKALVGEKTISAEDVIPNQVAKISRFIGTLESDPAEESLKYELDFTQQSSDKQYFHIILQQRWVTYDLPPGDSNVSFHPWFNRSIYPEQVPIGFIPSTSEPFNLRLGGPLNGIMFDNQNMLGLTKLLPFSARNAKKPWPNAYLESRVILRTVSSNYFKYYFSSTQYYRTKGTPLTEPVIIHNNISGGLGNFSGYSADTSVSIHTYY